MKRLRPSDIKKVIDEESDALELEFHPDHECAGEFLPVDAVLSLSMSQNKRVFWDQRSDEIYVID